MNVHVKGTEIEVSWTYWSEIIKWFDGESYQKDVFDEISNAVYKIRDNGRRPTAIVLTGRPVLFGIPVRVGST